MKAPKPKPSKPERKSLGEQWAAEVRAKCNKLTRAERERLLERAMQLAYGERSATTSNSSR